MRKLFGDTAACTLPSELRTMWRTRNDELPTQEFESLPSWMAQERLGGVERVELEIMVESAMARLRPRLEKTMRLRIWHDLTLDELGQILGVSRERVRQIEKHALRKLRYSLCKDVLRQQRNALKPVPQRLAKYLALAGVYCLGDLTEKTEQQLLKLPGINSYAIEQIKRELRINDLSLHKK